MKELLDCFVKIAPSPKPIMAVEREVRPEEPNFTGFVFKIHANMDPNHRSCIAFVKICSGKFERNVNYKQMRTGKTMRFAAPTAFMAQKKDVVDEAYPGDIVGIPDTGNFKIGDTLTAGEDLHFKGLPSFSPEMFKYIENTDPMAASLSALSDSCSLRLYSIVCSTNTARNADGSRCISTRHAGLRATMPMPWQRLKSASISLWRWTVTGATCFLPIPIMCCRWRSLTSRKLNSISQASFSA